MIVADSAAAITYTSTTSTPGSRTNRIGSDAVLSVGPSWTKTTRVKSLRGVKHRCSPPGCPGRHATTKLPGTRLANNPWWAFVIHPTFALS